MLFLFERCAELWFCWSVLEQLDRRCDMFAFKRFNPESEGRNMALVGKSLVLVCIIIAIIMSLNVSPPHICDNYRQIVDVKGYVWSDSDTKKVLQSTLVIFSLSDQILLVIYNYFPWLFSGTWTIQCNKVKESLLQFFALGYLKFVS